MQKLFHQIFSTINIKPFAVKYPNGQVVHYGPGGDGARPAFTVHFKTESAMRHTMTSIDLGFGEAYLFGDIEVEGSLRDLMEVAMAPGGMEESVMKVTYSPWFILRHLPSILRTVPIYFFQTNTYTQSRRYIAMHYDLGNDFFRMWLDKDMLYTCGYFASPDEDLDAAQERKREHICRKLMLKPGERLLDIGCGWGGTLIYAAKHYGVSGLGITLSKEQKAEAMGRIVREGLQDKIRVEVMDYRDLPVNGKLYDKAVAVGVFEHIGKSNYPKFLSTVKRSLKPNGLFMLHFIGNKDKNRPSLFGRKYLFPGVYTPALYEATEAIAKQGMRIQDVENLRLHYSFTADRWLQKFEQHEDEIRREHGEVFVRIYKLYLNHGSALMKYGACELFQVLITPGINNELPLGRAHLYRNGHKATNGHSTAKPVLASARKLTRTK